MKCSSVALITSCVILVAGDVFAHSDKTYANFPVTLKSYSGEKRSSVSYGGQIARHLLHNSLKKMAGKGIGQDNPELRAKLTSY